jgi:hypothetical protein
MLNPIRGENIPAKTGPQLFVKEVPGNLIYVADSAKISTGSDEEKISIQLLIPVSPLRMFIFVSLPNDQQQGTRLDRTASLAKAMALRPNQKIILAQSVGYPKKAS